MPRPLLIFSQSDYLIQFFVINLHTWWQTVQIQISWLLQKPTDLDLHCLQNMVYPGSAGQGLTVFVEFQTLFFVICWICPASANSYSSLSIGTGLSKQCRPKQMLQKRMNDHSLYSVYQWPLIHMCFDIPSGSKRSCSYFRSSKVRD